MLNITYIFYMWWAVLWALVGDFSWVFFRGFFVDVLVGYLWVFFLCVVFFCVNGGITVGVLGCVFFVCVCGCHVCVFRGCFCTWAVGWVVGRAGGWVVVFFVGCGLARWLDWGGGSPHRLGRDPPTMDFGLAAWHGFTIGCSLNAPVALIN